MSALRVLEIGEEILAIPARNVLVVNDYHKQLAENLVETMYSTQGSVGIAAPQVGVSEAIFVLDVSEHKKTNICHGLVVMCNPVVVSASTPVVVREGCMSVPHLTGDVRRASEITVTGMDLEGNDITIETDAFEARAFLHEIDHLAGKLFIDRVDGPHALFRRKKYL